MDRFDDGIEEWREEMANSDSWQEQRKANYVPPAVRRDQALEFIEREYKGIYEMLKRRAWKCINERKIFDLDYEIKDLKRQINGLGYDAREIKQMFKGSSNAQQSTIIREMLLEIPQLAQYTRIRSCSVSEFYPQLKHLEGSAAINTEEGGDFAA